MFGAFGQAPAATCLNFISRAAADDGLGERLRLRKPLAAVGGTRSLGKRDIVHNALLPAIEVDPETYQVRVDGEIVTSRPATELALAQRYFLF